MNYLEASVGDALIKWSSQPRGIKGLNKEPFAPASHLRENMIILDEGIYEEV